MKKGAEAELERRTRWTYVPEDLDNAFPARPKNMDSGMPQLYAMYGDKSYDSLSKKTASSMKYENVVLAPALSYFHDFLKYTSATVTDFESFETDYLYDRLVRLENSIHGVYTLLCNRFTVLQLRASLDGEGASKADADSLRAKLKFVEDCVYECTEGLVTDYLLKEYLDEFDKGKNKAAIYANMKHAALVETGNARGGGRGAGARWRDEKKEQRPAGGKGKGKEEPHDSTKSAEQKRGVDVATIIKEAARVACVLGEAAGREQVAPGAGLPMAEQFLCEVKDTPRIFVKFMKVMVEALGSPDAAEDRRELLKLKNGRVATPCYERERVRRVLARLGLSRNEKKGQWEPGQLIEHLGLEVDLREGLFRVTGTRVNTIHAQARSIICDASREKQRLSARRLAAFNGLCQSVYLAVPAARMYLRELYFVLTTKRSWGAKVKLTRQALYDLEWWLHLPVMSRWNGRKIWRSPTRAKLHTDSSLMAWGGVLNLHKEARGFWPDKLRHLHITHIELEAVFETVQAFMRDAGRQGGTSREERVERLPGGKSREERMERLPGGTSREERVEGLPGGASREERMEGLPGGTSREERVENFQEAQPGRRQVGASRRPQAWGGCGGRGFQEVQAARSGWRGFQKAQAARSGWRGFQEAQAARSGWRGFQEALAARGCCPLVG
ncbi:hypothetical protein CYMTET_51771 [Cymbomonas tetramitiformis]|uniref:Uncharacterized protein n=1 Tax=Cymbomonas tetramitiformis TaxID=36881 RepID=A0AAE0ESB6_9CHLO|nr:hypothetical protein CYMTET_51771 [Cymbomonas tetramitiformis]